MDCSTEINSIPNADFIFWLLYSLTAMLLFAVSLVTKGLLRKINERIASNLHAMPNIQGFTSIFGKGFLSALAIKKNKSL